MGLSWGCGFPSLTGHARGLLTSLVTLLLLQLGSAQLRVVGPDQPVTATMGQDVVLPCHLSPQRDARSLEVRWIRDKFSETVHHYRNGEDLYGEQMWAYAGRTELLRDGLSAGRLDLRITGLRTSEDGQYICIVKDGDAYDEATVHLVVSNPFCLNGQTLIVVVALVLVLLAVSIGLCFYLCRKKATQRRELAGQLADQGAVEDEYRANTVRERQSARLRELATDLAEKSAELEEKNVRLEDLTEELEKKDVKLREQAAENAELKAELEEKNVRLAHQSARLKELAKELEKKDAKLREQAAEQGKVTLDPRTAHPMLVLSQDNRSVRRETERQQVPKAPERFDTSCCVLGCEEFREGRHCWEVEVEGEKGTYSSLAVGVAKASVKRKGKINMSPEEGIWAVQYNEGLLTSLTSPPTHLSLSPVPTRLWVCLDCTEGQVSFINHDNRVKIFTFTDVFLKGEGMLPWFWLGTNAQLCLRDNTL